MYDLVPLNCLPSGQSAQVGELLGRADQVHRLQELGLRIGTMIQMVRQGSPCIVRIGEKQYGFRSNEMLKVLVKPGAHA